MEQQKDKKFASLQKCFQWILVTPQAEMDMDDENLTNEEKQEQLRLRDNIYNAMFEKKCKLVVSPNVMLYASESEIKWDRPKCIDVSIASAYSKISYLLEVGLRFLANDQKQWPVPFGEWWGKGKRPQAQNDCGYKHGRNAYRLYFQFNGQSHLMELSMELSIIYVTLCHKSEE